MRPTPEADDPHPAINISKIPVGGGVAGAMVAAAIIIIGLIGVPITRPFLAASIVLGGIAALVRRWLARD